MIFKAGRKEIDTVDSESLFFLPRDVSLCLRTSQLVHIQNITATNRISMKILVKATKHLLNSVQSL